MGVTAGFGIPIMYWSLCKWGWTIWMVSIAIAIFLLSSVDIQKDLYFTLPLLSAFITGVAMFFVVCMRLEFDKLMSSNGESYQNLWLSVHLNTTPIIVLISLLLFCFFAFWSGNWPFQIWMKATFRSAGIFSSVRKVRNISLSLPHTHTHSLPFFSPHLDLQHSSESLNSKSHASMVTLSRRWFGAIFTGFIWIKPVFYCLLFKMTFLGIHHSPNRQCLLRRPFSKVCRLIGWWTISMTSISEFTPHSRVPRILTWWWPQAFLSLFPHCWQTIQCWGMQGVMLHHMQLRGSEVTLQSIRFLRKSLNSNTLSMRQQFELHQVCWCEGSHGSHSFESLSSWQVYWLLKLFETEHG